MHLISFLVGGWVFLYAATAFMLLEPNPFLWSFLARAVFVVSFLIWGVVCNETI